MAYHFTVVNVYTATNINFIQNINTPFVVISIVSPEFKEFKIPHNVMCKDILSLRFHDVDSNGDIVGSFNPVKKIKVIDDTDLKNIIDFINKNKNIYNWLIHCEAGISRSTGTAMAISQILNNTNVPEKFIESMYGIQLHNVDIKQRILRYYGEKS